jgi:preprotein translocase SecE subunit
MPIEDIFTISGRGTVVTGRVERGIVKVGDEVEIVGIRPTAKTVVTGWRCSASSWTRARLGTTSGCCCAARRRTTWSAARCWRSRARSRRTRSFEGEVYVLTKEEGGRHTPFFKGYRPQFYFRTTDVTGVAQLPEGTEMVMPGDNVNLTGGADRSDRDGEGRALRDPRGRPHGRRRHRHRDHRVAARREPVRAWRGSARPQRPGRREEVSERGHRPVAQLVEHRSPKPAVGGSSPSWPANPVHDRSTPGNQPRRAIHEASVNQPFFKTREFLPEVRSEMRKVTFPSRDEVVGTTIVVIVTSVIFAVYLWVADQVITPGVHGCSI